MPQIVKYYLDNQSDFSFVNSGQPIPTPFTAEEAVQPQVLGTTPSTTYATFSKRFIAALIDSLLVGFLGNVLLSILGMSLNSFDTSSVPEMLISLVAVTYSVLMLVTYGATLGKMAMHIKVQDAETGANLTYGMAILRETVGKMLSLMIFCLGYLWMFFDEKKQTWHDKIANSIVVKN